VNHLDILAIMIQTSVAGSYALGAKPGSYALGELFTGSPIVENAADDSRFSDNPLVTGDPGIRFYAAIQVNHLPGDLQGQWNGGRICGQCVLVRARTDSGWKQTIVRITDKANSKRVGLDLSKSDLLSNYRLKPAGNFYTAYRKGIIEPSCKQHIAGIICKNAANTGHPAHPGHPANCLE